MASHHPIRKTVTPEPPVIPDKLYFRIGDVAALCDVPAYVLRFWETEFPQLKPNKGGTGQRLYRKRDVETALRIKGLLYDQGYTIPGARQILRCEAPHPGMDPSVPAHPQPQSIPIPPSIESAAIASPIDIGAAIRQDAPYRDQLTSLRAELRSLADLLGPRPAHPSAAAPEVPEPAPPRLKLMRPRALADLRPETRSSTHPDPRPESRPEPRPESRPAPRLLDQGDLFPVE